MEVINNFFKKEPNLSFVTAKIQQNCTDTGNDNSEATRQRINCAQAPWEFHYLNTWLITKLKCFSVAAHMTCKLATVIE